MVSPKRYIKFSLIIVVLGTSFFSIFVASAQTQITYSVSQEWVQVWINTDGSIDIKYNITMTYLSAPPEGPQGIFTVGMPQSFRILEDLSSPDLQYKDVSSGNFFTIDVYLKKPIIIGNPNTFILYVTVPEMIHPDKTNPESVGMLFIPSTFQDALGSTDLRVAITLPVGVNSTEVLYPTGAQWDNVYIDGNNLVVYWENRNWSPSQKFTTGVSFPEKYVTLAPSGPNIWNYTVIGVVAFVVVIVSAVGVTKLRKATYEKPRISVEALGAARGLTAVEAGVVLGLKPVRVLTMVLFGLLLKRIVMVTEAEPIIKLQRLEKAAGEPTTALRYYEIDYLKAIEPAGTLDERMLARTYLGLTDTVNQKLRGYSREDTVNYYKSIVNQGWTQVTQAGTPELKGDVLDKNIEWLLADDKFDERFKTAFPPDIIMLPLPGWWWYWRGPYVPLRQARVPSTTTPEAKPILGQDFANNVVRSLETASNNIVKNVQDFTNRLIPAAAAAAPSERSVRERSSCVCACAACACACACVSCACACAGGGAR
jgi:hypothetical protein